MAIEIACTNRVALGYRCDIVAKPKIMYLLHDGGFIPQLKRGAFSASSSYRVS